MMDLDVDATSEEVARVAGIRREFWKARERQRKAAAELMKFEREVQRKDLQAAQINGKIERMQGYVRFIEGGWVDERVLAAPNADGNAAKSGE